MDLKTVYQVLWGREAERIPHFGNSQSYTRSLSDLARGGKTRQRAHEIYRTPVLGVGEALGKWLDSWGERGFPPRLDLFKAAAAQLAERRAHKEVDLSIAELGPSWLRGFLNRHPTYFTKFSVTLLPESEGHCAA